MNVIEPTQPRYTIENTGNGILVSIPAKRQWFGLIFMLFWLGGWACGEVFALTALFGLLGEGISQGDGLLVGLMPGLFLMVWLGIWTVGGAFAIYNVVWQLIGKDEVEINRQSIRTRKAFGKWGRWKEYAAQHVRNLHQATREEMGNPRQMSTLGGTAIGFDYGAKTITFGQGMEAAEARQLLAEILRRYPQYELVSEK